MILKSCNH